MTSFRKPSGVSSATALSSLLLIDSIPSWTMTGEILHKSTLHAMLLPVAINFLYLNLNLDILND